MEEKHYLPEDDTEDPKTYPNYTKMKRNFNTLFAYKYNDQVYPKERLNGPLHDHFVRNRLVFTQVLTPDAEQLLPKLFLPKEHKNARANALEEQTNFLDAQGVFLDASIMMKEAIESEFSCKVYKDCRESTLAIYYSQLQADYVLINFNKWKHSVEFYKLTLPPKTVNQAESSKLPVVKSIWKMELETPQDIRGLRTFNSGKKTCLLIKFHNNYIIYALTESKQHGKTTPKIKLQELSRVTFKEHFIHKIDVNEVTETVAVSLISVDLLSRKLVLNSMNGNIVFETELGAENVRSIQIFGPRNEVLIATSSSVCLLDPTKNLKNTFLNFDEEGEKTVFVHSAFYFDNYKMFGLVTDTQVRFIDFRFPKNGILSFGHSHPTPPDFFALSKNLRSEFSVQQALDTGDFDTFIDNIEKNGAVNSDHRMFLYSLRKGGCSLTLPCFDYQEKEEICNQFVYKLIKEINTSNYKHNKFLHLLNKEIQCTGLFGGNLAHSGFRMTGFQAIEDNGRCFVVTVENHAVLNLQILVNSSKPNDSEFVSFLDFEYREAFNELFEQNAVNERLHNIQFYRPEEERVKKEQKLTVLPPSKRVKGDLFTRKEHELEKVDKDDAMEAVINNLKLKW